MIKQKYFAFSSILLIFFVLTIPRICAQSSVKQEKTVTESDAGKMRLKLIETGKKYLGKPYKSGGTGPDSFDCSGFVYAVAKEALDIKLPRTARDIYSSTTRIKDSEIQAGDLVFFKTTSSGKISHVGICIGDNHFIHSASDGPKTGIIITDLSKDKYWKKCYVGAGRFLQKASEESLIPNEKKVEPKENPEELELVTPEII